MPGQRIGRKIIRIAPIESSKEFDSPVIYFPRPFGIESIHDLWRPVIDPVVTVLEYGPAPEVILIAGVTSPDKAGQIFQGAFTYNLINIIPFIAEKYEEVKITSFDFNDGTQTTRQYRFSVEVQKPTVKNLGKIKKENYRHQRVDPDYADTSKIEDYLKMKLVDAEKDNNPMYYRSFTDKWKMKDTPTKQEYIDAFENGELTEQSISIGDVYKYLVSVPDDSLAEFHIFSHSFPDGPVLIDTEELVKKGSHGVEIADLTHSLDKDARQKHFEANYHFIPDLSKLDKKFTSYGFSHIWGCLAEERPKKMINKIINAKNVKLFKKAKNNYDDKVFTFYWKRDDFFEKGETDDKAFHIFMNDKENKPGESDTKSLNDIIAILKREMENSYMDKLSKTSKRFTMGALPGTGGDLDKSTNPRPHLMHVDMGRKYGDSYTVKEGKDIGAVRGIDYTGLLKFYSDIMGIKFKPDDGFDRKYGRGYAVYEP